MRGSVNAAIELIDYQIRELAVSISKSEEYSEDTVIGIDFEFLQHESDPTLFLIQLDLSINGDIPETTEVLLRMKVEVEGYVRVPENLNATELRWYLVGGTSLIYSTFRGTLAALLGQTAASDYILPVIDFEKVATRGEAPERRQQIF